MPAEIRNPQSERRSVFFLSPHLDDVAFSCGGALARLLGAGVAVTVGTVFTASVAQPTGFALDCQLDKGLSAEVDYMAQRRKEDDAFGEALRAEALREEAPPEDRGAAPTLSLRHGPLAEAPHRGYASAEALFSGVHAGDDDTWQAVRRWLVAQLEAARPALLFAPQGLGNHVDHLHVAHAVRSLVDDEPAKATRPLPPVVWYRDLPYALRAPEARPCRWVPTAALKKRAIPLSEAALEAKLRGAAAYETQLGFQFGGEAEMRAALADFARAEGHRLGSGGPAESVLCPEGSAAREAQGLLFEGIRQ